VVRKTWPPWAVTSLEKQLDALADAVRVDEDRDIDEQIWLTRFLVIRTCGYLEQVVQETVTGYLHERAGGTVKSFSLSWMNKSRNPSPENLLDIVGKFDGSWRIQLQELLDADDKHLNKELYVLVQRRHQIAHGLNEGLNSRRALELVATAKTVADWFISQFNPDPVDRRRARV
jgi:hypothetical protein